MKNYLSDRKVRYQATYTVTEKRCTKECPQGSVLGPFLWNLMMDILLDVEWPEGVRLIAYADDVVISIHAGNRAELERIVDQCMGNLVEWALQNKLTI